MRLVPFLVFASACGGHYRTELVGQGSLGSSVQLASGAYDLDLAFQLPRAQVVEWTVTCGGTEVARGSVGETFEQYKEKRLAQLAKERADEKATAAGVTSLLVGAVAPRARAGNVTASVDPNAAGAVVAASMDDRVALPPGDVGGGNLAAHAQLARPTDGACIVAGVADDPTVAGTFRITRVHDLDAEAHERTVVAAAAAVQLRTRISTQLVTYGADVDAREQRRLAFEAEAQRRHVEVEARAEAARRAEAERQRQLAIVVERQRELAFQIRGQLSGELVMWGADAGLRERRRAELELRAGGERRAYEARMRIEADAIAERERLQLEIALRARTQLRGYLVGLGAFERPPMPALIAEAHGSAPFDGAVWLEGRWTWNNHAWVWVHGGWNDPGRFGATGGEVAIEQPRPLPQPVVGITTVVVETAPPPVVVVAPQPPQPPQPPRPPTGGIVISVPVPTIVIHGGTHRTPPTKRHDPVVRDHR